MIKAGDTTTGGVSEADARPLNLSISALATELPDDLRDLAGARGADRVPAG